jgi:hypothetical protein
MEDHFGYDFGEVRLHTDARAAEDAAAVCATAFTFGQDIVFARHQFAPNTSAGQRLLAHELTHVAQQAASGPVLRRQKIDPRTLVPQTSITPNYYKVSEWLETPSAGGSPAIEEIYWAEFEVDKDGVMRASVRTTSADRALRSGRIRFGQEFQKALQHFDKSGIEVRSFEGDWSYMTPTEISDNLKVFKEKMELGGTREAAARATPSGKVATRLGFEVTHVENVLESQSHLKDAGANRWRVKVSFKRLPASGGLAAPTTSSGGTVASGTPPASTPGSVGGSATGALPPATSGGPANTTAQKGAPLKPVSEATPGYSPARGAALGGAIQMLQSMQFSNLQRAEVEKFQKKYAELQPKIDKFLEQGLAVELVLVVEKPNHPDFFCKAGVYCDQSQFIYFNNLFINYLTDLKNLPVPSKAPTKHATMSTAGGPDSRTPHTGEGGSLVDVRFLRARREDYHIEHAKQTLYPQTSPLFGVPGAPERRQAAQPPPQPQMDLETKRKLAAAPSRVVILPSHIYQSKISALIQKAISNNSRFAFAKDDVGWGSRKYTRIVYFSNLDKPRAEELARIAQSLGITTALAERSGDGLGVPGSIQVMLGLDAGRD